MTLQFWCSCFEHVFFRNSYLLALENFCNVPRKPCVTALLSRLTALLIDLCRGYISGTSAEFSEKLFFRTITNECFSFLLANISLSPRIKIFM